MNISIFYDLARFQKITDTAREKITQSLDLFIVEEPDDIILDDLNTERIKTFDWNHPSYR